jgi:hypothetical protein
LKRHRLTGGVSIIAGREWKSSRGSRFPDMVDIGSKVQPPQRHAKLEPQPGHDAVAIATARAAL